MVHIQNGHEFIFVYILLHQVSKLLARKFNLVVTFLLYICKNKSNVPPFLLRRFGCLVNTMDPEPIISVGANIGAQGMVCEI